MEKKEERRDCLPESPDAVDALESRFSDVRGNEIMEEVLEAVREYTQEKGDGNEKG